ncbi:Transcriptional regulator, MerR family [hydrothermal vent metagenome]|uniref:Transcriptional regulator, MerR family n=1 Tax=hydrothermal vent metagenome TaxID=652676 RepID=A0A3B0SL70_9ZZZZ
MSSMTIGKLAKSCEVKVDTVRYYEQKGLVLPLSRTGSGYRVYSADSVKRLRFIRKAQHLGFTLGEIKELLALSENPDADCAHIREKAQQKNAEIDQRIADLVSMKESLTDLTKYCPGKGASLEECSILAHFYEAGE